VNQPGLFCIDFAWRYFLLILRGDTDPPGVKNGSITALASVRMIIGHHIYLSWFFLPALAL